MSYNAKHINLIRARVIQLLPDTCVITTRGTPVVNDLGYVERSPVGTIKQWRGQDSIPCRIDKTRAFRPAELPHMTTIVNEFEINLPYDVDVTPNDIITVNGKRYEIRQLRAASKWEVVVVVTVTEVDFNG